MRCDAMRSKEAELEASRSSESEVGPVCTELYNQCKCTKSSQRDGKLSSHSRDVVVYEGSH